MQKNTVDEETIVKGASQENNKKVENASKKGEKSNWRAAVIGGVPGVAIGAAGFMIAEEVASGAPNESLDESVHSGSVSVPSEAAVASSVNDEMSFSQAFAAARAEVGPGGVFEWHGHIYGTYYKTEWDAMTEEQKDDYAHAVSSSNLQQSSDSGSETDADALEGEIGEDAETDADANEGEVSDDAETNADANEGEVGDDAETDADAIEGEVSDDAETNADAIEGEVSDDAEIDADANAVEEINSEPATETVDQEYNDNGGDFSIQNSDVVVHDAGIAELDEGETINVIVASVDGHDSILVDVDQDGYVDVAVVDVNDDGSISDTEIHDIQADNTHITDLANPSNFGLETPDDGIYEDDPDYTNDADVSSF